MKAIEYLDAIKDRHHLPSDYAAAKLLGVTRMAVSRYRNGRDSFSDSVALRAAELLDKDPAAVLIDCQMERAPDTATRAAWGALLKRIGGHAAVLAGLSVLLTFGSDLIPPDAQNCVNFLSLTVFRSAPQSSKPRSSDRSGNIESLWRAIGQEPRLTAPSNPQAPPD